MPKTIKYCVFKTRWGYFGLAGSNLGLLRCLLPVKSREKTIARLLKNTPLAQYDKNFANKLQQQIISYFQGCTTDFKLDLPLSLDKYTPFTRNVLAKCRNIPLGQTISYSQLAKNLNSPHAARAVGSALAQNPLPLIIPCHRVIKSDGCIGHFSAPGGTKMKQELLKHEQQILRQVSKT